MDQKLESLYEAGWLDRGAELILSIRLPLAPSTNHLNTQAGKHKGRVKLASVTRWDNIAVAKIRMKLDHTLIQPEAYFYTVLMLHTFKNPKSFHESDADNRLKQALDSLARALGVNDNIFISVQSIKAGVAQWQAPSTLILVQAYPMENIGAVQQFAEIVESVDE